MKRIVSAVFLGFLFSAVAFAQDQPDKVWSINFAETGYTTDAGTDPNGIVPDTNWFNCTLKTGSDTVDGLSLSWSSPNTWRYASKTFTLMKAYIDDSGSHAQVNVGGLDASKVYELFIYCASDNASCWTHKTVNGVNYTFDGTLQKTVIGTATWGDNSNDQVTIGVNVLPIEISNVTSLAINGNAPNGSVKSRGCIAAIQIVERGEDRTLPKGPLGGTNLIRNGSFETGTTLSANNGYLGYLVGGTVTAEMADWTATGTVGLTRNGTSWLNVSRSKNGLYAAFLQQNSSLSQTFVVPEGAAGDYHLSFFYAARNAFPGEHVHAVVDGKDYGYVMAVYSSWQLAEFRIPGLTEGEHTLELRGDTYGLTTDMAVSLENVALEKAQDGVTVAPQPTLADYRLKWSFDNGETMPETNGNPHSYQWPFEVTTVSGPNPSVGAGVPTKGWCRLRDSLDQEWTLAASVRVGVADGVMLTMGGTASTNRQELVFYKTGATTMDIRLVNFLGAANKFELASLKTLTIPEMTNRFHTIILTHRPLNTLMPSYELYEVYLDGALVGKLDYKIGDGHGCHFMCNGFQICGGYGSVPSGYVVRSGDAYDDLRFYNRALSPDEARLYAETFPPQLASDDPFVSDAVYIAPGETKTFETTPAQVYNFGTMILTGNETVTTPPHGPGLVKYVGSQTIKFNAIGNSPVELNGDITIGASTHLINYWSSPLTISGGTVTMQGTMDVGTETGTIPILAPTWGSRFFMTGGVLNGSFVYLSRCYTENEIVMTGGEFRSGLRAWGDGLDKVFENHRMRVEGGTFAPALLTNSGGTAGTNGHQFIDILPGGTYVPLPGAVPVPSYVKLTCKGRMLIEEDVTLPAYQHAGTLEFRPGKKLSINMAAYAGENVIFTTDNGFVFPEGKTLADIGEFVELRDTSATLSVSDDGKSLIAVPQVCLIARHHAFPGTKSNAKDLPVSAYVNGVLPRDGLKFLGNTYQTGDKEFAAEWFAGSLCRVDGWLFVTSEQAGEWAFSACFDDYVDIAIDGTWIIVNGVWSNLATAAVEMTEGWHRFTVIVGDGGTATGAFGASTNSPFPLAGADPFPIGVSVKGGEMVRFTEDHFTFGDPTQGTTGDFVMNGAGAYHFLTMKPAATCRVVIDPVKSAVHLYNAPTFTAAGQLALAADTAASTNGRFLLMSWEAGTLTLPAGVSLNQLFDASSCAAGCTPQLSTEVVDGGVTRLWLDLAPEATKRAVRVWATGDSITQGSDATYGNWRIPFAKKMLAQGYEVTAIGYRNDQSIDASGFVMPAAWTGHSGISGQRVISSVNGAGTLDAIENLIEQAGNDIDLVLLQLGANDFNGDGATAETVFEAWKALVAKIIAQLPTTKIVCGAALNNADPAKNAQVTAFNALMAAAIEGGDFPANQVYFADLYAACPRGNQNFYLAGPDLSDAADTDLHPWWRGADGIAEVFASVAKRALEEGAVTGAVAPAVPTTSGSAANVPPAYLAGFKRARVFDVAAKNGTVLAVNGTVPYEDFSSETGATDHLTRVGYYVELKRKNTSDIDYHDRVRWLWVDMDATFGEYPGRITIKDVGVPINGFTRQGVVNRLHVVSNMPGIETVEPTDDTQCGFIEFWPYSYTNTKSAVEGAPESVYAYDWSDTSSGSSTYGSMQVHRLTPGARNPATTLFVFNRFTSGPYEIGLGNFANNVFGSTDWTFSASSDRAGYERFWAEAYEVAKIEIWTQSFADDPDSTVVVNAHWTGAAGTDDVTNPANWACSNAANRVVANGLPGVHATVHLAGPLCISCPVETDWVSIVLDSDVQLTGDCDWRGIRAFTGFAGRAVDLKGHKLFMMGPNETTSVAWTCTDTSAHEPGELHVDVPTGATFNNTQILLDGNLKLVKEGAGLFIATRANQPYTGGTTVLAGTLRPNTSGMTNNPFGGYGKNFVGGVGTLVIETGASLDINTKKGWGWHTVDLHGGAVVGLSEQFNCVLELTADSVFTGGDGTTQIQNLRNLNGHTLTATIRDTRYLILTSVAALDPPNTGKIVVLPGQGRFQIPASSTITAPGIDFDLGANLEIKGDLSCRDLITRNTGLWGWSSATTKVFGKFTPVTDYFPPVQMQNGSMLDLSDRTVFPWSTLSLDNLRSDGTPVTLQTTFSEGALVTVDLGTNTKFPERKVISWNEQPTGVKFVPIRFGRRDGRLVSKSDGLYFYTGISILLR